MDLRDQVQAALNDTHLIERELGGGGMSRVYLAEERALGRRVVIKVLPPELSGGVSIDRFKREIAVAARLQHPHIVPLFSAGDVNGLPYFTMPFVEGHSLRERLAHGELPVADVIAILRDVAKALAHAHSHGVAHRDIKPDNILLSGHAATVTDFGVAKALSASTGERGTLTDLGVALGTPAYMSPEQATADTNADHRTDIYALGVVGYEMLTGQTPFGGRSPQQLLAAHVTEAPVPVEKTRQSVPPALSAIIMRCLEKRPADRYQQADELLHALDAIATPSGGMLPTSAQTVASTSRRVSRATRIIVGAAAVAVIAATAVFVPRMLRGDPPPNPNRLAVAPFTNATGDSTLNAIGLMAADWATRGLAELDSIEVVSFSSALSAYRELGAKNDDADVAQRFARRTRAGRIVTGSYHKSGNSVLVQPEIVDAVTGKVLQSFPPITVSIESPEAGVEEVRQRVMGAIATRLVGVTPARPPTYAAYKQFIAGAELHLQQRATEAIAAYRIAVALDSSFVEPFDWMIQAMSNSGRWREADSVVRSLEPRTSAMTDEDRRIVEKMRAMVRGDLEGVRNSYRAAAARDSTAVAVYDAGWAAMVTNRPAEAAASFARVKEEENAAGWYQLYRYHAVTLHALDERQKELDVLRRGRVRHPQQMSLLQQELAALAAQGSTERLKVVIDSFVAVWTPDAGTAPFALFENIQRELRAHGHTSDANEFLNAGLDWLASRAAHPDGPRPARRFATARMLYVAGNLDSARALIRTLPSAPDTLPGTPADSARLEVMGWFGMIEAKRGDVPAAEQILAMLSADKRPYTRGKPSYARARILAVLGRKDEAVAALRLAFRQGYRWSADLHVEPAFLELRNYPAFIELVKPKG